MKTALIVISLCCALLLTSFNTRKNIAFIEIYEENGKLIINTKWDSRLLKEECDVYKFMSEYVYETCINKADTAKSKVKYNAK